MACQNFSNNLRNLMLKCSSLFALEVCIVKQAFPLSARSDLSVFTFCYSILPRASVLVKASRINQEASNHKITTIPCGHLLYCLLDGQELLFNPLCRINVLLENIKARCNCEKEGRLFM